MVSKEMIEKILQTEFELIVKDLKAKHIQLGMKASGDWINGVELQIAPFNAKIYGEDYTEYLVSGRPPSTKLPPISAIKKWIEDKGIIPEDGNVTSLAYAIATKIKKEGTNYHKQGGTDLISAVITPERTQMIIDKIGAEMTLRLVELMENKFQEAII